MRPVRTSMSAAVLVGVIFVAVVSGAQPRGPAAVDPFPTLSGPYFGAPPPGDRPRLFMPGIVSTTDFDGCAGCLLDGRLCVFSSSTKGTRFSLLQDGRWTSPRPVPWQNQKGLTDFTIGPDGRTVFFQTSRPTSVEDSRREANIWVVEWTGGAWSEPRPLPSPPNSDELFEGYPSVSVDGTLYFFSISRDVVGVGDIFRSALSDGAYGPAELLPHPLNSSYYEVDPVVAPDGSYLLFGSGRPGGFTALDLYVCFRRDDGRWTAPVNAGRMFNTFGQPTRLTITPDGRYLFFPSAHETRRPKGEAVESQRARRWGDHDSYWVSTGFLRELQRQVVGRQSAAEAIIREYRTHGHQAAVDQLEKLLRGPSDTHYLELSELLIFCGELVAAGKLGEADTLVESLAGRLGEVLRIRTGYATACILNGHAAEGLELMRRTWQQFPTAPSRSDTELSILAFLAAGRGHLEDELAVLRFATEEFPGSDGTWLDLARAYERRGEIESSRAACARALELSPDSSDAAALLERLDRREPVSPPPSARREIPVDEAAVFHDGAISTEEHPEMCAGLSADGKEFYFNRRHRNQWTIFSTRRTDGTWTEARPLSFSAGWTDRDFTMSPDGRRIYFGSDRPREPGGQRQKALDIHVTQRRADGTWGEPENLGPPVNTEHGENYPSVARNGNLYFFSCRGEGLGGCEIYVSRLSGGSYLAPENLGPAVNSAQHDWDAFIAPDESYIIFSSQDRPDTHGKQDLYVSFRDENGEWRKAVNMGRAVNSVDDEICPSVSLDGRYLFFTSRRRGQADIFWIDAAIIERLNPLRR